MEKAIFLDRDGVINIDKGYVYKWQDFELCDYAIEGLKGLMNLNYKLIIITNQSGIARGYYSQKEYASFTNKIKAHMEEEGVHLTGVYHCPHHPLGVVKEYSYKCTCRKPEIGMIIQACEEHKIDIGQSILVGDKQSDLQAAIKAGIQRRYLISNNSNVEAIDKNAKVVKNLNELYLDIKE